MKEYLDGAISHLQARANHLLGMVPRDRERDLDVLITKCQEELAGLQAHLEFLVEHPGFATGETQTLRLRRYRRAVEDLEIQESVVVAALHRWGAIDTQANRLAGKICQEINFPLPVPVVSCTSPRGAYYHTYTPWNLIVIPLAEGRFLLHFPDLYHELAHLLFDARRDPRVEAWQRAFHIARTDVLQYVSAELDKENRGSRPQSYQRYLMAWSGSWESWLTEFFCDVFATCTLGPAFAWSHLHLCAGFTEDPYLVPRYMESTHPADAARMGVMLRVLEHIGHRSMAATIHDKWATVLHHLGAQVTPEYGRCYPSHVLDAIAKHATQGVTAISCTVFDGSAPESSVGGTLNEAWAFFWRRPREYATWEREIGNPRLTG